MTKKIFALTFIIYLCFCFLFFLQSNQTNLICYAGVDISGLSQKNATKKVEQYIKQAKNQIDIKISFEDKIFEITDQDLQLKNMEQVVKTAIQNAKSNHFLDKINIFKNRSQKIVVPTANCLDGFQQKIQKIKEVVERQPLEPQITFKPKAKQMFSVKEGVYGVTVNEEELMARIVIALEDNLSSEIALPVIIKTPRYTKAQVEAKLKKRSEFSTNYSSSVGGRRHNVLLSLLAFNGLTIEPGEVVSFNQTVFSKVPASSFQVAKIIVNGEFVDGRGGGMCQASSTLYNALLLADMTILESHSHSLPVGYVKVGFDAMVNPGTADLVFKNDLDFPIFIKTYGDDTDCFVEIYGEELPQGLSIKRKSQFVRSIKHDGDKVVPDTEGKFSDKILFKGEYYRVKYPVEGCEAKSYLQYYLDGELIEERFVRHSRYNPQQGVVYEGTQELIEGLTQPTSTQNFIPPATETVSQDNFEDKIKSYNPSNYNQ